MKPNSDLEKASTTKTSTALKIEQLKMRIIGTRPLLLCRGETANPFDPQAREIKRVSQKKNKTDDDHSLLARLQFEASCYYDEKIGVYLPCDNFMKSLEQGASTYKEGNSVKSFVLVKGFVGKELDNGAAKVIYDGPHTIDDLYGDKRFVSMRMGKLPGKKVSILVVRPIFNEWMAEFLLEFTDLTKERVLDYATVAGRVKGVGAWRPRYGTFRVEVMK